MPKLLVVYYGRFCPPHYGHKNIYDHLTKRFGDKNVYVATSDKIDNDSPFSFDQRRSMLSELFGIDHNKIIKTNKNYNVSEVCETLSIDPSQYVFVVALGEKDSDRFANGKYYKPLSKKVETMDKSGYYYVIPNMSIDGKVINARDIRTIMSKDSLNRRDYEFIYNRTGLEPNKVELLRTNLIKESNILTEGAVGGHISHPYEDLNMTFAQMFDLIDSCLSGQLSKDQLPTEKFDGQNMFATVKNRTVYFSRNKTNLKNYGKNAMTITDVTTKWKDKSIIDQAFTEGCKKIQKALLSLDQNLIKDVFDDGRKWLNFEIVWNVSKNVIDYDRNFLVVHGITIIDQDGNKVATDKLSREKIIAAIQKMNDSEILPPNEINIPPITDFSKKAGYYKRRLRTIMTKQGCNDFDTLGKWLTNYWLAKLIKLETKYGKKIQNKIDISRRIAIGDTSVQLKDIKSYINDAVIYDEVRDYVKNSTKYNNEAIDKISTIWLQVGSDVIKNIDTFLLAGNNSALKKLRSDIDNKIQSILKSNDIDNITKMRSLLRKMDQLGGIDSVLPTEGIVFMWNGKTYKLTGIFAPLNQLLGINRYK